MTIARVTQTALRVLNAAAIAAMVAAAGCRDRVPSSPELPPTDAGPSVVSASISNGVNGLVGAFIGQTIQLNLSMQDSAGQPVTTRRPFWSSSNPAAVSVDSDGTVEARAPGEADVVASIDLVHAKVHVRVGEMIARLGVRPDSIPLGSDLPIRGVLYDAQGNETLIAPRLEAANADYVAIPNPGSSGPVSVLGVYTKAIGSVVITDLDSRLQTTLYVTAPIIDTLASDARSVLVPVGASRPLSAIPVTISHQYASPARRSVQYPLTWTTSNPAVVRVDSNGVATGIAEGDATVKATALGHATGISVHVFKYATSLRFTGVAPAVDRTCALDVSGTPYCWGAVNGAGLGGAALSETLNDAAGTTVSTVPLPVGGGIRFASLAQGPAVGESCGIATDGDTYCWGTEGSPSRVPSGVRFTTVSIGAHHACGLTADGSANCWGFDVQGRATAPQPVAVGLSFTSIAAGTAMTCGLTATAQVYCWPVPTTVGSSNFGFPVPLSTSMGFRSISLGAGSCGLGLDSHLYCWGPVDNPPMVPRLYSDDPVSTLSTVSVGRSVTCGMRAGGGAVCLAPSGGGFQPVSGDPGLVSVSVGSAVCGITAQGILYCWRDNEFGQAGAHPVAVSVNGFALGDPSLGHGISTPAKVAGQP
jgi:hypothetical protein